MLRFSSGKLILLVFIAVFGLPASSQNPPYDIGNPVLLDLFLSPAGNDSNDGLRAERPLRTLEAAWRKIPEGELTTSGYRLNLLPGPYPCGDQEQTSCINYFSDRTGSLQFPVIIRALGGKGTTVIRGGLNLARVKYLYLIDLDLAGGGSLPTNSSGNNLLHIEGGDHILLRGLSVLGPVCTSDSCNNLQEVLKVNQTQFFYVEDCDIGGAWHSSIDYFVVQHGHLLRNRLHSAGQWCTYIKGGSAYIVLDGNEFSGCQLGFQAGQSANFAVMKSPWLHHEVYYVRFINNILHDIPGVGMSVAGGYNVLFAYNTMYKVGVSLEPGYPIFQAVRGDRNCTATDEVPNFVQNCLAFASDGGWGPTIDTATRDPDELSVIPNRNVFIYNNVIWNPAPSRTAYSQFEVRGPITPPDFFRNVPSPSLADENLVIAGNQIWNGPVDHPLGVGDSGQGCSALNPTCNEIQLRRDNSINQAEPNLVDPEKGNLAPRAGGVVGARSIPDFPAEGLPSRPAVPAGSLSNQVLFDREGRPRPASGGLAGAYLAVDTPVTPCQGGSDFFIAGAAHAGGAGTARWITDVTILNRGPSPATLKARFLTQGEDNRQSACVELGSLPPSQTRSEPDIVQTRNGSTSWAGGIVITSSTPGVLVLSRTYNQSQAGTFGMSMPGMALAEAVPQGVTAHLFGLSENASYRTNLAFLNPGEATVHADVRLVHADGLEIGTQRYELKPLSQFQVDQIFTRFTSSDVWAGRIEVTPVDGPVFAFATVIDNVTSDPSYIGPER